MSSPKKIAIVGGGISGIACSWTLRNDDCDVDIYEADKRLGGHANSVPFKGNGRSINVDTGFIAMDEATYPQFSAFLQELGVETTPTDMSFGVSAADSMFEWGSYSIRSFVGSLSLLFSTWFWRLAFDIVRFILFAEDTLLADHNEIEYQPEKESLNSTGHASHLESIGDYLKRKRYSTQFRNYFLIPMVAAPWCIDPEEFARTFPARPLIQFMLAHRLLDTVSTTLKWRSFRNGSKTYVDAFEKNLPARHQLHLGTKIEKVEQHEDGASIIFRNGISKKFDHVVLAIHANQALTLLGFGATNMQRSILSSFKTSRNICYLHSDETLLPKRLSARVAWNCFLSQQLNTNAASTKHFLTGSVAQNNSVSSPSKISITFDMNKLQDIPRPGVFGSPGRVLVTMNPVRAPYAPQSKHIYYHPLITSESITMSRYLNDINGVKNISFAGAWMGYGFHEDGFVSGAHVARMLISGREKTAPLDLIARVESRPTRNFSLWLNIVKIGISTVQKILEATSAI
ncbi:hypothetical protein GQ44DRAFT_659227 [Phaeosphaeriaceae sp. PMI808]|nr:hypothetical protein GQ44DRAFT_659227 [Phaeosphaeriaceae sp. PMI808]